MSSDGSDNLGDVRCRGCGYLLRGLPVTANCPECARPASFSTVPDELRYSDPTWLRRTYLGVRFMLVGWTLIGAVPLAFAYAFLAVNLNLPLSESIIAPTATIGGIGLIMLLAGSFLSTIPNTWIDFEARRLRVSLRMISVASVVLAPPIALSLWSSQPTTQPVSLSISAAAILLGALNITIPLWAGTLSTRSPYGYELRAWRWAAVAGVVDSLLFMALAVSFVQQSQIATGICSLILLVTLPLAYVTLLLALTGVVHVLREEIRWSRRIIGDPSWRSNHAVNRSNAS